MPDKIRNLLLCAASVIVACDDAEPEFEANVGVLETSRERVRVEDEAIAVNYCDHAEVLMRAEFRESLRGADGDLARARERALLDEVRAGEAVFADAERMFVRQVDEVDLRFEDGWLIAAAPGRGEPLARLRLADGARVHVFADAVRTLTIADSVASANMSHLLVMTDLAGAVDVVVEGAPSCLVIDGGGDAAAGPLRVDASLLDITAPQPVTLHATGGDDVLQGSEYMDFIYGYGGNDTIFGWGMGDFLYGNEGNDRIYGGGANFDYEDMLYGGKDNDKVAGESVFSRCAGDDGYDDCGWCGWYSGCP